MTEHGQPQSVDYLPSKLPTLFNGDVVVIGGSLAGVATALELAKSGKSVALIEPRTYLGREITATLRPWLARPNDGLPAEPLASFLEVLKREERAESDGKAGASRVLEGEDGLGEIPFTMDSLKLHLEDLLLEAGVKLLYVSLPVAVVREAVGGDEDGTRISGVVIGNKSGRQFLGCMVIVDASETGVTLGLLGGPDQLPSREILRLSRTLEFDGLSGPIAGVLDLPVELGLVGNEVRVHPGHRGSKHALVECQLEAGALPGRGESLFGHSPGASVRAPVNAIEAAQLEMIVRARTMDVAIHLMNNVEQFGGAYLAGSSLEAAQQFEAAQGGSDTWEASASATSDVEVRETPLHGFASVPGIWYLGSGITGTGTAASAADPVLACYIGKGLATRLLDDWASELGSEASTSGEDLEPAVRERERVGDAGSANAGVEGPDSHDFDLANGGDGHDLGTGLRICEPTSPQRGRRYELQEVGGFQVPTLTVSDVLVVGGGTSGATAATTAANEGLSTVLVEMNPGLGGTGTYGGVNDYWFGRRVGFAGRLNESVNAFHSCLQHDLPDNEVPRWNIEAKAHVLLEAARRAGVRLLLDSFVIGTLTEGNEVRGVVAATRYGPVALLAKAVIDASGDGDVAAYAGAESVYGSEREHVTMWYSLAQFGLPGHTRNNFTSTVNVGNVEDYTRAILAGRRRKRTGGRPHDHGTYVAPRETRHILGDVVLTLTDQLMRRCWPDVVNVAFSNNDVKGHTTSDWVRMGLISPNLEVEVPYRALLPRRLENILVVGKALSATHDALPAIRMQADLENLGGVAALAASEALRSATSVRNIDVRRLQRRLKREGVLTDEVLDRQLVPWQSTEEDLRALIAGLSAERPLYAYSDMKIGEVFRERIPLVDICCAGPHALPLLRTALHEAEGPRKVLLAQALAILGDQEGVPTLVAAIEEQLATGLPPRASGIRHAVAPPDQGAMPEVVYLIHSLGMARDPSALRVWSRVAELLEGVTEDDVRDPVKDVFDYVDSVCVGVERLGDKAALPVLERLHGYRPFNSRVSRAPYQVDYFEERMAYLELAIGRAMARCSEQKGLEILIAYLEDSRAMLAEHAHSELILITGHDLGKDPDRWRNWLGESRYQLTPQPWLVPTDPIRAWGEQILVPAGNDSHDPASFSNRAASR